MNYSVHEDQGVTVITLDGSILGGPEANTLNNELHRLIGLGKKSVVVDLAGVSLMNSTGLGLLIGGYTALKNAGGTFALSGANENIRNLIRITKLQTIFHSYPALAEAIVAITA
jgi:anti-sigma B factor antagonist